MKRKTISEKTNEVSDTNKKYSGGMAMSLLTRGYQVAAILLALLSFALPANAFSITPLNTDIDALPGESYSGTIHVEGGGGEESGHAYISDWKRLPNGDHKDNEPGTLPRSCGKWLALSPTQFEFSANEDLEIRYSFNVPADATGSYWTYVMVESKPRLMPPNPGEKTGLMVNAVSRFAFRLVINVSKGRNVLGKINRVEVVPEPVGGQKDGAGLQAGILFENTGNTFINARCYLETRNFDGEVINQSAIHEFYSFPESEWWVRFPIDPGIPPGEYMALVVVDYGGASRVAGETRFTVPGPPAPEASGGGR